MMMALQKSEKNEARQTGRRADGEKRRPPGRSSDEARSRREVGSAESGECREQRVLRGGMQRVAAQRREISDENHRADGAGEVLRDNSKGEPGGITADHRLPGERQGRDRLQRAADPEACRQREGAGNETAGKAADQGR